MADLTTLVTYPGQSTTATSITQFCRVELVTLNLEGDDEGTAIEDLNPPSVYAQYTSPRNRQAAYDEDDDEDGDYENPEVVVLTFYTAGGEESRNIMDSEAEGAYVTLAQVLTALGQQGWEAVNVVVDANYDETWYLQRTTRG